MSTVERIFFLDSMRGVLMTLGVFLHSLQVFNAKQGWLIYSTKSIPFAESIINLIHLFRMPAFFIVSGYFAIFTLKKYGVNNFLKIRILRIVIPFVTTVITLNSLQVYILTKTGWMNFELLSYITQGEWITHLWFLINLSIFFFCTYIAIKFFNPVLKFFNNFFHTFLKETHIYIILFLFSFIIVMLLALFSIITSYVSNPIVSIRSIFFYFPFFILGILIFTNKNLFNQFINLPIFNTLVMTTLFVFLSYYFKDDEYILQKIAYYFFDASSKLFASALCFTLFYKFFNQKSNFFSLLAEASYSIYLTHHILVIIGGIILIKLDIGGYLGFSILILFTISFSLMIHHFLISKIDLFTFLYNGKSLKSKKVYTHD